MAKVKMDAAMPIPRTYLYLLAVIVTWLLADTVQKGTPLLRPASVTGSGIADLDSFSEASVAVAVLRNHVRDLYQEYIDDFDPLYRAPHRVNSKQGQPAQNTLARQWIQRLQVEIQLLNEAAQEKNLELALLMLYKENQMWKEFLDCYLTLLDKSPSSDDIHSWAQLALACSMTYGRTEEILSRLQHIARFGRDSYQTQKVQGVLA